MIASSNVGSILPKIFRKATSENLNRELNVGYPVRDDHCMTLVAGYKKRVMWRIIGDYHTWIKILLSEC